MTFHKLGLFTCSVMMLPVIAVAQSNAPASGRWVLDVSKSKFTQAAPKSMEVTLSEKGKVLNWQSKTVGADGKVSEASGEDVYGQASKLPGGRGSRLLTRVSDTTVKRSFTYADGSSLKDTCTISGKKMTCLGSRSLKGKSTPTKSVFNKAE